MSGPVSIFAAHSDESDSGWYKQQHFVCNQTEDLATLRDALVPTTATGFIGVAMKFDDADTLSKILADLVQRRNLKVQLHSTTAQSVVVYSMQDRSRNADIKVLGSSRLEFPQMTIKELAAVSPLHMKGAIQQWLQVNTASTATPAGPQGESVLTLTGQAMSSRKVALSAGKPHNFRYRAMPRIMIQLNEGATATSASGIAFAVWGYAHFNNLNQDTAQAPTSGTRAGESPLNAIGGVINTVLKVGAPLLDLLLRGAPGNSNIVVQSSQKDDVGIPTARYMNDDQIPVDLWKQVRLAHAGYILAREMSSRAVGRVAKVPVVNRNKRQRSAVRASAKRAAKQ